MGDESWRLMREDPNKFYTEATDLCIGIKKLLYLFKLMVTTQVGMPYSYYDETIAA